MRRRIFRCRDSVVRSRWRDDVFETSIRDSTKAIEAALASCDVIMWAPKSPIAQDYRALAAEVEARVHAQ